MVRKIISGGQTGADRAALDFAMAQGIPHGGWCPQGRVAEDGMIDARYQLTPTPSEDSAQRTEWNVRDSDGTVIISIRPELFGGSRLTREFAILHRKPYLHVRRELQFAASVDRLLQFLEDHQIHVLNVAGPRASEEAEVARFTRELLEATLTGRGG